MIKDFLSTLFSVYGLIIFALGVVLAGTVMSTFNSARSKVAGS